jgi:hypothetical protein
MTTKKAKKRKRERETDEDEGEEGDAPRGFGLHGDGGDDDDDGEPELDPASLDDLLTLPEREQEEAIAALARDGHDVSVVRSRLNAERRKKWASTAELVRLRPEVADDGTEITGLIRSWRPPFNDTEIRDFARKFHGGGQYAVLYYDANHAIRGREVFSVSGKTKTPAEAEALQAQDPPDAPKFEANAQLDQILDALGGGGRRNDESELLREQIRSMQTKQMLDAIEAKHEREMAELKALVREASQPKQSGVAEMAAVLAPFVPVMEAFVKGKKDDASFAEIAKTMKDMQKSSMDQIREVMGPKNTRPDPMQSAVTKMVDLAIANVLGKSNKKTPDDLMMDMVTNMIPNLTERAMEISDAAKGDGDGEITPRFIADKVAEMLGPITQRLGLGAQPPGAYPPGAYPPGVVPMPPAGPAIPMGPPPQPPAVGTLGGDPFAAQRVVMPMPGQVAPGQAQPPQQANPAYPYGPPTSPPPAAPQPHPAPPPQAPAVPAAPLPPAPAAGTPADDVDVHPQVFIMAAQYLAAGKSGEDLAGDVEAQVEQGIRLLSEKAIQALEQYPPSDMLIGELLRALPADMPPEVQAAFVDPQTGQMRQEFHRMLWDFIDFFHNAPGPEDEEAGEEAEAPEAPAPETEASE